jgi:hypothetical protein
MADNDSDIFFCGCLQMHTAISLMLQKKTKGICLAPPSMIYVQMLLASLGSFPHFFTASRVSVAQKRNESQADWKLQTELEEEGKQNTANAMCTAQHSLQKLYTRDYRKIPHKLPNAQCTHIVAVHRKKWVGKPSTRIVFHDIHTQRYSVVNLDSPSPRRKRRILCSKTTRHL